MGQSFFNNERNKPKKTSIKISKEKKMSIASAGKGAVGNEKKNSFSIKGLWGRNLVNFAIGGGIGIALCAIPFAVYKNNIASDKEKLA